MSSWQISGEYMETCNCALLCPCITSNLTAWPTEGDCKAAVAMRIDKGSKDGVQLDGLAFSPTSKHYSIKSEEEAEAYLAHPVLGPRLLECAEAVLQVEGRTAHDIFGSPDDLKLRSSATLFTSTYDRSTATVSSFPFRRVPVASQP